PLSIDNLSNAIRDGRVDFVLTNPASYAELEIQYGISRIATLRNRRAGQSYTKFGALIFTRADRDDIQTLNDLKGKTFAAVHPNAFGGWWMAWREMQHRGLRIEDLGSLQFTGLPQDQVVQAVMQGKADAGTVRTNILERMQQENLIPAQQLKILSPQMAAGFPFAHSTRLYPEWPFAKARQTENQLAQQVAIALLSMAQDHAAAQQANSAGWTIPLDYQPVHELMQELSVGPYKTQDVPSIIPPTQNAGWAVGAFMLFGMTLLTLYVNRMNRKLSLSKQELEREIEERKRAQDAERIHSERIKDLYEASALPGLSPQDEIEHMLSLGCRMLNLEIAQVCKVDEEKDRITLVCVVAPEKYQLKAGIEIPLSDTFCGITYNQKFPLALNNVGKSNLREHLCYTNSGLQSYIGTPLWVNNQKYGTINFSSSWVHKPFTDVDQNLLKLMGRWVAKSIERQIAQKRFEDAKDTAESASQAKSAFLANMSHELRTPLNAIIGYSDMLQEDAKTLSQSQLIPDMVKIQNAGKHLLAVINDILDLSKIEAGKMEIHLEQVKLAALVQDSIDIARPLAESNNNTLSVRLNTNENMITDANMVRQCLLNLISNACKFTHDGEISVTIRSCTSPFTNTDNRTWISMSVSDTGIGIPEHTIKKLFQNFSQADSSTTRAYGGTGLGLAISQHLAKMLGGIIHVNSTEGKGSTFIMYLPQESRLDKPKIPQERPVLTAVETNSQQLGEKLV
ncbi:MAG: PhnD/SsuA/transferrin family substrate-binding protein, partial [Gammaproteobacteria bacterium]|nr:PhnD/SsuA/transferrin family substrate-binding protein [Gammaproteobacteria bacterium]